MFCNVAELVEHAERKGEKISNNVIIHDEMKFMGSSKARKMRRLQQNQTVMKKAIERGMDGVCAYSGLNGDDVVLLKECIKKDKVLSGEIQHNTVSKVVTTNEVDAAMRKICTTPMGCIEVKIFGVSANNG